MVGGVLVSTTSILAFAALQFGLPETFSSTWSFAPASVPHFQHALFGKSLPALPLDRFIILFRLFLSGAWAGYVVAVGLALVYPQAKPRTLSLLVVALPVMLAVFGPPSLSNDTYSYIGHARLWVLYDENPYISPLGSLRGHGDPTADYLNWNVPSVYGPFWMVVSFALVRVLQPAGLWWQIATMKLLAGTALIVMAHAGRALARHFFAEKEDATFLAIGLNPLLLIEGPLNGHNDLLMVALLMAGGVFYVKRHFCWAGLALGLSIGIKAIPVLLLPLLLVEMLRRRRERPRLAATFLVALFAILPTAVCYVPLWRGVDTFGGQRQRLERGAGVNTPLARLEEPARRWFVEHGWQSEAIEGVSFLIKQFPLVVVYLGLAVWIWRRGQEGDWLTAWPILALPLIFCTMGVIYPWYLVWPFPLALARWERRHLYVSVACLCLAVVWTLRYSVPEVP
jgi:hypothetical protein